MEKGVTSAAYPSSVELKEDQAAYKALEDCTVRYRALPEFESLGDRSTDSWKTKYVSLA